MLLFDFSRGMEAWIADAVLIASDNWHYMIKCAK